ARPRPRKRSRPGRPTPCAIRAATIAAITTPAPTSRMRLGSPAFMGVSAWPPQIRRWWSTVCRIGDHHPGPAASGAALPLRQALLEPVEGLLGDLPPAVVDRERVTAVGELPEVSDRG